MDVDLFGLSASAEFEVLTAIETRVAQVLTRKCNAVLSGSITSQGRRELYFYGSNPEELDTAVNETKKAFPTYQFASGSKQDSEWRQYLDVLFPSD